MCQLPERPFYRRKAIGNCRIVDASVQGRKLQYPRDFQYRRLAHLCNVGGSQTRIVAPSGGGSIHMEPENIDQQVVIVKNDDKDWDLQGV